MTAQEEYWDLAAKLAEAERLCSAASSNLQDFFARHPGETVKAFPPDAVCRAMKEEVQPWEL